MNRPWIHTTIVALALIGPAAHAPSGQTARGQSQTSIALTLQTPEIERLDLALDEIELQWPKARGLSEDLIRAATGTLRATVRTTGAGGAVFAARTVVTLQDLGQVARELEEQNRGSVAHLVLYQAGGPRGAATRRLLGREVAVMLDDGADPDAVLKAVSALNVRPVATVPRAYVVEAADPVGALGLAETLRQTPGVRTAYPLLQRRQFSR